MVPSLELACIPPPPPFRNGHYPVPSLSLSALCGAGKELPYSKG
jgi:hypothetical protein